MAREAAGFDTAAEAIKALGVKVPTYNGHENGAKPYGVASGALYARQFNVSFEWLMLGTGPMWPRRASFTDPVEQLSPQAWSIVAPLIEMLLDDAVRDDRAGHPMARIGDPLFHSVRDPDLQRKVLTQVANLLRKIRRRSSDHKIIALLSGINSVLEDRS